jgi:hypothetical protein
MAALVRRPGFAAARRQERGWLRRNYIRLLKNEPEIKN